MGEPLAELRSANSFYESDGLGTVTSLSNSAGALANTYGYDSFGNATSSTGTVVNPFRYTGREFDSDTGLYYYRARYYDPQTGRFLSEDPVGFEAGANFYAYVLGNPVNWTDPAGLDGGDAPGPPNPGCLFARVCGLPTPPPTIPSVPSPQLPGFPKLVFDRNSGTLTLYGPHGEVIVQCLARNNTTPRSKGPWPNGTFPFSGHNTHTPDPNGPYGSYGIDLFAVPGRTGMGVHSGRNGRGGPDAPTLGCIRTTDNCMNRITSYQGDQPIKTITVK